MVSLIIRLIVPLVAIFLTFGPTAEIHAGELSPKLAVVSFGLFGDQDVFRREATGAAQIVASRFGGSPAVAVAVRPPRSTWCRARRPLTHRVPNRVLDWDPFGCRFKREKIPGGGASGKGVGNRIEAGGADCGSVAPGLAVSGESEIGGFFGGSATVCGRCSLRAVALIFFFGALAAPFGTLSGAITGAASGGLPGNTSPSRVKFTVSNHCEILAFRSSIAAHAASPKLADTVIEASATRA